jgi:uncharacterized protein YjbI with pentapeptide repeats
VERERHTTRGLIVERNQQTPRERILEFMKEVVPNEGPTRKQVVWSVRITIVVIVVVLTVLLLLYGISFLFGVELMNLLKLLAIPITIGAAVPLLNWLQKRRELEFEEQRAKTDALLQFLDQLTQLLLDKDKQKARLVKMDITPDIHEVISARTEAIGPNLTPEGNQSLINFLFGLGLLNKADPIISLAGRNFSGVDWSGTDLREVDLTAANLRGAVLSEANLERANLERADLVKANLNGANFEDADLQEAHLSGTSLLGGANLKHAVLNGADLSRAQLGGAQLQEANLAGANLQQAILAGAYNAGLQWYPALLTRELLDEHPDMRVTNLEGAILAGADLSQANLRFVNLQGADLQEAELQEADLQGANLLEASVTDAQLANTRSLQGATMPDGSEHP